MKRSKVWMVCFKGCTESVEEVFGSKPLDSLELNKKLWNYIRKKKALVQVMV